MTFPSNPLEFLKHMEDHRRPNPSRQETAARALTEAEEFRGYSSWEELPDKLRDIALRRADAVIEALDSRLAPPVVAAEWPCRSDHADGLPPRLVSLLYLLLRDYVQPGDMEQAALQSRDATGATQYSNPHLVDYARSLASYALVTLDGAIYDWPPPDDSHVQVRRADELQPGDLLRMLDGSGRWRKISRLGKRHERDGDAVESGIRIEVQGSADIEVCPPDAALQVVPKELLHV